MLCEDKPKPILTEVKNSQTDVGHPTGVSPINVTAPWHSWDSWAAVEHHKVIQSC